jgi:hypothetical protein
MSHRPASGKRKFQGPAHLHDDANVAFQTLAKRLSVTTEECQTHTILHVGGFSTDEVLQAAAVYLVASIAQCVHADMQIRQALFDEATRSTDLAADIQAVIGKATCTDTFKSKTRDPWIWEAISHLVVHLSTENAGFHPSGTVLAKTLLKHDVNDHGLDLVAIYGAASLGITAGESKAYLDDPSRAVQDASLRLKEIDEHLRDVELRATVTQLRPSLARRHQKLLGSAFWHNDRTYYPFICYDDNESPDWTRGRKSLGSLGVPVSRKFLVPLPLRRARAMFDDLSTMMRAYAADNFDF